MKIDIDSISKKYKGKNVLVIGDIIIDSYIHGKVDRISQEAPVPIVRMNSKSYKPGGAANVALNLLGLGAKVRLIGCVGDDSNHDELKNCFEKNQNITLHLVECNNRPTTVKTRIIADGKHVARLDEEITTEINIEQKSQLKNIFNSCYEDVDGIIIEDYNKGTITSEIISHIIDYASKKFIPVYVDPKFENYDYYRGVRLFKPNLIEFNEIVKNKGYDNLPQSGFRFQEYIQAEILLLTLGAGGMSLFHKNKYDHIPTRARKVYDVSGAGDTVIATFALTDICGIKPLESSIISNLAAGRVCEEIGVYPIDLESLKEIVSHHHKMD